MYCERNADYTLLINSKILLSVNCHDYSLVTKTLISSYILVVVFLCHSQPQNFKKTSFHVCISGM